MPQYLLIAAAKGGAKFLFAELSPHLSEDPPPGSEMLWGSAYYYPIHIEDYRARRFFSHNPLPILSIAS